MRRVSRQAAVSSRCSSHSSSNCSSPEKELPMIHPAFLPRSKASHLPWNSWDPDVQELRTLAAEDFEVIRVLGVGTYGVVKLAKHKPSGCSVALKVLSKEHVVATRQEKHILRERAVHLQLQHPLVARLYGTFQDDDCLYLVIEYLPGGELWSLVYSNPDHGVGEDGDEEADPANNSKASQERVSPGRRQTQEKSDDEELRPVSPVRAVRAVEVETQSRTLDASSLSSLRSSYGGLEEEHAVFYLGCILSALEYLHDQGLLYRDLKLENLVLDSEGYLKVLDFGFAKPDALLSGEGNSDKVQSRNLTLCGSMDYMAPEVLLHQAHDHRVDMWSFGIIMYELLLGKTPFYHENPRELGRKITTEAVAFPNEFEEAHPLACDLISQLLVKNPDARLASIQQIKTHSFFTRAFPSPEAWTRLLQREREPPFVPELSGAFDTSFFQTIDDEEQDELESDVEPYFEDGSHIFRDF